MVLMISMDIFICTQYYNKSNMDEGECYINTQFARVLQLTRIIGAAPVRLTRVDRSYRVAISRKHVIYSSTITGLLAISVIINAFYYTYCVQKTQESSIIAFVFSIRVSGDITSKILSLALIAYNGQKRFSRIIKYLIQINEINAALDSKYITTKLKKSAQIFWSISTLLIFVDFVVQLCDTTNLFNLDKAAVATSGTYSLINICVYVIEIQYIYILCLIKSTTNIFNRRLRFCFTEAPLSLHSIASVRRNTNHFFRVYVSLCDLLADFNNGEGAMLLSFILFHISNSVIVDIFIFIDHIIKNPMNVWLWATLVFFIHKFTRFAVFVEACHRINMEDVRQLVSELSANSRGAHAHLKCFQMDMLLHNPVIAPLGLFAINRTFILMVLGGMVTYVTVLNQFYNNTFN